MIHPPIYDSNDLNHEHIANYFSQDKEFLDEILRAFKVTLKTCLDDMEDGINAHDFQKLMKATHKLKGSVMNFGPLPMVTYLEKLEALAKDQSPDLLNKDQISEINYYLTKLTFELEMFSKDWH